MKYFRMIRSRTAHLGRRAAIDHTVKYIHRCKLQSWHILHVPVAVQDGVDSVRNRESGAIGKLDLDGFLTGRAL